MDDTTSPRYAPLYQQIKTLLVQRLANNEWPPGIALPSETALAKEYSVSQGTVRKALTVMELENLIERRQGRGTFAAGHGQQRALFQFFHLVGNDGERQLPDSRVVGCELGKATLAECEALDLDEGASATRVRRIRRLDGLPVISETLTVATELFPNLENYPPNEIPNTLYEFYESKYGIMIAHASERLRVVPATAMDAQLLDKEIGSPLLEVDRRALDIQYQPVEWRISHCDTELHYYFNELD